MGRFRLFASFGVAVLALLAVACSSSDPDVSSVATNPPTTATTVPVGGSMMTTIPAEQIVTGDTLVDRTFVSTSVGGHTLVAGTEITMSFTAADISIDAGCNTMNGGYSLQGGTLVVTGLSSTLMGCEQALMDQDAWIGAFLESSPQVSATGPGISLSGGTVVIELATEAEPGATGAGTGAAALVGPTWTVHTFVAGTLDDPAGSASGLPASAATAPTFTFSADGTVEIFTGCNRGSTSYVAADDGSLTFEPMMMTMKACEDQGMQIAEVAVTTTINDPATFSFDGADLVLTGLEGSMVLSAS